MKILKAPLPSYHYVKGVGFLSQIQKANVKRIGTKEKQTLRFNEKTWSILSNKNRSIFFKKLTRNMALAASVLICIAAVRAAEENPDAKAVFNAVQEQLTLDLDENLGRLTFVSNMLPEAAMVFWNSAPSMPVNAPVDGDLVHVWNASEPYISMVSSHENVYASADGEVMNIAHGENEERILRIRHEEGIETLYGNLATCSLSVGDHVEQGEVIGTIEEGEEVYFELRQDGRSIDPTYLMKKPVKGT